VEIGDRISRYKAIEAYRKRPLIVYATSTRWGVDAKIAGDQVRELIDQIDAIDNTATSVDVLLHSTGGDPLAAWKLMSVLRERFATVGTLVPFMAFSAATLFALGADEIVMGPHASLGPIDPQLTTPQRSFSYEELGGFLRFLREEVKLTEQMHVASVIEKLLATNDPLIIGKAKRASELSTVVGERLLLTHMKAPEDRAAAREIAHNLNKSFFDHGDAISRGRARELKLKVAPDDRTLEGLIWDAYLGIEAYMQFRTPFNPVSHVLADPAGAALLAPSAPLALPPNAPQQMVQALWNQVAQQAVANLAGAGTEIPYALINGIIESPRRASQHRTVGRLSVSRHVGGDVQVAALVTEGLWAEVAIPVAPPAPVIAPVAAPAAGAGAGNAG
jgi:Serine dehydrogenase proteinase